MRIRNIIPILAITTLLASCGQKTNNTAQIKPTTAVQTEETDNIIPDFRMSSIDGNEVSALEEAAKHKVTVIDFWASWCGPCLRDMPGLVATYNKYKDKGLGIIGVSLDQDRTSWEEAVKRLGMTWIQLSDLQGWDNAAAQLFGVQAIPFTVIIDKDGKLIEAGLRGEGLDKKIASLLDNSPLK